MESSPPLRKAPTGTSLRQMELDRFGQQLVDPVQRLGLGVGPLGAVAQVPVALDPGLPVLPYHVVRRRQRPDPAEEGLRRMHEPHGEVLVERERATARPERDRRPGAP